MGSGSCLRLCLPVALHNAKGQKKGDSLCGMAHEAGSYASSSPHCRQEVFFLPRATAGCSGMFIKHTTKWYENGAWNLFKIPANKESDVKHYGLPFCCAVGFHRCCFLCNKSSGRELLCYWPYRVRPVPDVSPGRRLAAFDDRTPLTFA